MIKIAVIKNGKTDNEFYIKMWCRAFAFWDLQFDYLYMDKLTEHELEDYSIVLLATGIETVNCKAALLLERYVERGGSILISGYLPEIFSKYFNGLKVTKVKRDKIQRCIRIKNSNGFMNWEDGEILFFTNTCNCSCIDFTIDGTLPDDIEIPALSEEMSPSPLKNGIWEEWKDTTDPAIMLKRFGMGKILYTPFAIGAMEGLLEPASLDLQQYLYAKRNDGLYLFIRNILEYLAGGDRIQYKNLWPEDSKCVVCITGDVHDYKGIPGREDREWNDMRYNFRILEEYGLAGKATFYISGEVARKHPDVIREGLEKGYELCPHTYRETQYAIEKWDYSAQREDILKCIDAFERAAPGYDSYKKGFRTHGYQSNEITRKVLKDLGYEYIADMQAWETTGIYNPNYPEKLINYLAYPQYLPHVNEEGEGLLEIPDTFANDHFVYRIMKLNPQQALDFWKKQFDKCYRLGGMFQACLHPYISLKEDPEREKTYRGLLEYIMSHKGVSFMTMGELNKWWRKREKQLRKKGFDDFIRL